MIEKIEEIKRIKGKLGKDLIILAHHYQTDEIISAADYVGDSLKLAQYAEKNKEAKYIVFCGVHFMAETADILTEDSQIVVMPDSKAGCQMADMADDVQTERAWEILTEKFGESIIPITYVNSKASVKAFCGRHGGAVVTSSNAKKIVEWGLKQKERILFLPDQNLGRNTAVSLGVRLENTALYNQHTGEIDAQCGFKDIKVILWNGYCYVHHKITEDKVKEVREKYPDMKIIVHPECQSNIVELSDMNGSTEYIINQIKNSPIGSKWCVGTEKNLVGRLIKDFPDRKIIMLDDSSSCIDMSLTTQESLLKTLENIEKGVFFENQVRVDSETAKYAKKALDVMLRLS